MIEQGGRGLGGGARAAAVRLLEGVAEGALLSETLAGTLADLDPEARARAQRLATSTLRWAGRADRVLSPYLRKKPGPRALMALRMAVVEMLAFGAAPHGVVDAVVGIVKRAAPAEARFVNAVLRRVAAAPPDWDALPVPELPKWLRKPLVAAWGKPAVAAMEAAHARGAPLDMTPAPGAPADLAARLDAEVLPTGTLRIARRVQVTALPGYDEGWWWVQDAAAALPARVLDARAGERVLDLCAAPGGKTLQLAATGAAVTALDVSGDRLERLHQNLARTGQSAEVVLADALTWRPDLPFDAILLDAPCSATGTIRRHPDLPHAKSAADLAPLVPLQAALIDAALAMLRPGGRLVVCTCSLLPAEGEELVRAALARHPGLTPGRPDAPGIDPGWRVPEGLRLRPDHWPEQGGLDGFFIALLQTPVTPRESPPPVADPA